jgi:hypothetical protein
VLPRSACSASTWAAPAGSPTASTPSTAATPPPGGHALVGARIYVPADQLADPDRRAACGIDAEVTFRTKPQLALDICRDMHRRCHHAALGRR